MNTQDWEKDTQTKTRYTGRKEMLQEEAGKEEEASYISSKTHRETHRKTDSQTERMWYRLNKERLRRTTGFLVSKIKTRETTERIVVRNMKKKSNNRRNRRRWMGIKRRVLLLIKCKHNECLLYFVPSTIDARVESIPVRFHSCSLPGNSKRDFD